MWLILAFVSALLLGFYDVCKKVALRSNAVVPVLLVNTTLCALIAAIITLLQSPQSLLAGSHADAGASLCDWLLVGGKAVLVLSSWICGFFALKHLPLTIVGPVNATRPVMVLAGAVLIYGEHLNAWQWAGVSLALMALFLLKRSSKSEGIDWSHNRWIPLLILAAVLGAASGLFDKYLLSAQGAHLDRYFVQVWFNTFQALLMSFIAMFLWYPQRRRDPFHWHSAILGVSLFLTAADLVYFYALTYSDAMVSIVSMVRRCSVLVSFGYGAIVLREHNLRSKLIDLGLLALSLVCLALGG